VKDQALNVTTRTSTNPADVWCTDTKEWYGKCTNSQHCV